MRHCVLKIRNILSYVVKDGHSNGLDWEHMLAMERPKAAVNPVLLFRSMINDNQV